MAGLMCILLATTQMPPIPMSVCYFNATKEIAQDFYQLAGVHDCNILSWIKIRVSFSVTCHVVKVTTIDIMRSYTSAKTMIWSATMILSVFFLPI
jgi:hypothetical protein